MPGPNDVLSLFDSIFLGIVQGLTEFFPVSSDGHLALAEYLINYHKQNIAFDVLLHLGTLGSLFVVFHKDVRELFVKTLHLGQQVLKEKSLRSFFKPAPSDRWMVYVWVITFFTGLGGIFLEKTIEGFANNIQVAGIGFLVTSTALFAAWKFTRGKMQVSEVGWIFPILFSVAQISALFTGVSRSGMTIATGMLFGLQRTEAGRFSFVASIPIIAMAVVYEARRFAAVDSGQLVVMLVGVVASFVFGLLAIRGLMLMLSKLSLLPFAIYTLVLALFCLTRATGM